MYRRIGDLPGMSSHTPWGLSLMDPSRPSLLLGQSAILRPHTSTRLLSTAVVGINNEFNASEVAACFSSVALLDQDGSFLRLS